MSADSIRMGRAHVEIGGDDSPLKRVLRSVSQQIQATGQRIRSIGASILGAGLSGATALGGASLAFGAMGDDMAKMATRTGVAVEALSELRFVAERSGASASDLEGGLKFMGRFLAGAITPDKIQLLDSLGLSMEELTAMTPDQAFERFAGAISAVENPLARTNAALEIFGRGGTRLIPMLLEGSDGISRMRQEARDLGLSMSTTDAKAAEALTDKLGDMKNVLKMVGFTIGAAVAPTMMDLIQLVLDVVVPIKKWADENRMLFSWLMKGALAVAGFGSALVAIGSVVVWIGTAIGGLSALFASIGTVLSFLSPLAVPLLVLGAGAIALWGALRSLNVTFSDLWEMVSGFFKSILAGVSYTDMLTAALIAVGVAGAITFGPLLVAISPLLVALGALAGAAYAVYSNWSSILGAIDSAFYVVTNGFLKIVSLIGGAWSNLMGAFPIIGDVFGSIWSGLLETTSSTWSLLTGIVGSAVSTIGDMVGDLISAFGGMSDAFKIGDWSLLFDIGWTSVQLVFQRGLNWILTQWSDMKFRVLSMWDTLVAALGPTISPAIQGIVGLFFDLVQGIQDVINTTINALPAVVRDRLGIRELDLTGDRQATMDAIGGAFATPGQRSRDAVDTSEQERLQGELERLNTRASDALFDQEAAAIWNQMVAPAQRQAPGSPMAMTTGGGTLSSFSAAALSQMGNRSPAQEIGDAVAARLLPVLERQANALDDLNENDEDGLAVG